MREVLHASPGLGDHICQSASGSLAEEADVHFLHPEYTLVSVAAIVNTDLTVVGRLGLTMIDRSRI